MFGVAASPVGWNWNLVSRDQGVLVATVGLPVGLDDTVLSGGPIGLGRGLLAGRSVLDGVVPPFGVLATDGNRFTAQQDWFGMASMYVYRSRGVVAFSNRPMLVLTTASSVVDRSKVKACRFGIEWPAVLGEPSKGD